MLPSVSPPPQFTPYSWDNFEWGIFSSPKRCLQVGWGSMLLAAPPAATPAPTPHPAAPHAHMWHDRTSPRPQCPQRPMPPHPTLPTPAVLLPRVHHPAVRGQPLLPQGGALGAAPQPAKHLPPHRPLPPRAAGNQGARGRHSGRGRVGPAWEHGPQGLPPCLLCTAHRRRPRGAFSHISCIPTPAADFGSAAADFAPFLFVASHHRSITSSSSRIQPTSSPSWAPLRGWASPSPSSSPWCASSLAMGERPAGRVQRQCRGGAAVCVAAASGVHVRGSAVEACQARTTHVPASLLHPPQVLPPALAPGSALGMGPGGNHVCGGVWRLDLPLLRSGAENAAAGSRAAAGSSEG